MYGKEDLITMYATVIMKKSEITMDSLLSKLPNEETFELNIVVTGMQYDDLEFDVSEIWSNNSDFLLTDENITAEENNYLCEVYEDHINNELSEQPHDEHICRDMTDTSIGSY